jgi:two-component system cell cycle sensor histidine kinase/response regulator CckA
VREEDRYRALVESLPEGVGIIDAEGYTTYVNAALARMLGVEREAMIGRSALDFVPASRRGTLDDALARRRQGASDRYEISLKRPDGSELIAEVSATPIFDDEGRHAGSMAVVADVTARRREQHERQRLEARLQQAQRLETVGQLAGGIAHDFNNILAVILNYAHFVHRELPEGSPLRDDVQQIRHAAERASELTRQLLIFSRRDPAVPQEVDVNGLVQATERLLRRTLGERIALTTSLCDGRCFVVVDPSQLEHVLLNLVVNSRDAMPDGGTIEIRSKRTGDQVELSVSDDGSGMEPEVAARAFEPFFTTKPKGAGTGLGLATVYGTVTAAGGEVQIDAEPGRGTTVTVRLPTVEEPAHAPEPVHAESADGGGATILVVEDEEAVRSLTERILTGAGFSCIGASDGEEALELYRAHRDEIDVILTDVVMPGMSGLELAERIGDGPPVVYMSGYADEHLPGMLEKPFSADELVGALLAARESQ